MTQRIGCPSGYGRDQFDNCQLDSGKLRYMDNIRVHNINFIRYGSCKRCGACEKPDCPHLTLEDGLATCMTYGKGDYLEWRCNVFPDSPFCRVVREGICGFTFEPLTEEDAEKYGHCLKTWRLNTYNT